MIGLFQACGSGVSTRRCRFIRCLEFDRISITWA